MGSLIEEKVFQQQVDESSQNQDDLPPKKASSCPIFVRKKKVKLESFVFLETWLFPLAGMCTLIRFMTLSVVGCPQHPWSQLCPLCCIQHGAGLASLASPLRALSQTRPLLPFHLSRERAVLFLLLL